MSFALDGLVSSLSDLAAFGLFTGISRILSVFAELVQHACVRNGVELCDKEDGLRNNTFGIGVIFYNKNIEEMGCCADYREKPKNVDHYTSVEMKMGLHHVKIQ